MSENCIRSSEKDAHAGVLIEQRGEFAVTDCRECGFVHLDPFPLKEQLDSFYRDQYYTTHKSGYIEQDEREREYLYQLFAERLADFQSFSDGRDLLDVGCGAGEFIKFASKREWKSSGIEPSEKAGDRASESDVKLYRTTLQEFVRGAHEKYDIVLLKNVLEHVPHARETLKSVKALLKESGVLYLEVPNDFEFLQRCCVSILRMPRTWISIPDHVNYFNFNSLEKLLLSEGFSIIRRDTTFPMYLFPFLGFNFLKDKSKGKKAHELRIRLEMFLWRFKLGWLKRACYRLLAVAGLGRTAIFYCKLRVTESHSP